MTENSDTREFGHKKENSDTTKLNSILTALACSSCGAELSEDAAATLGLIGSAKNDDNDNEVKNLQKAMSEGLSIDYRCPKCRNCSDCRRSFETERVSLREEAEDMMVWDSVFIDWENKQIVCHLPLRGKEEEFL